MDEATSSVPPCMDEVHLSTGDTTPDDKDDLEFHRTAGVWVDYDGDDSEASDTKILDPKQVVKVVQPSELCLHGAGSMFWSVSSSAVETPGDSGVQCLDSETSDLTGGDCPPGMTLSLVGAEDLACDPTTAVEPQPPKPSTDIMTQSDIENQNTFAVDLAFDQCRYKKSFDQVSSPDEPPTGDSALKSASDDIVIRRKCRKKSGSNQSQPKKRVSFHEDILNNTKTDNIHIEHGFVSYRPEAAMNYFPTTTFKKLNHAIGRYSWCAVGDTPYMEAQYSNRNVRSDVLTYGRTDVTGYPDNSGIYEYENNRFMKSCDSQMCINKVIPCKCSKEDSIQKNSPDGQLYMCSCSSSDSNLSSESDTSSQTLSLNSDSKVKFPSKKCDNTQKSYSCDCIENNSMKPIMKTMYFSEANIDRSPNSDEQLQMSDILPKASCLKKSALKKKRYITTDVIEEHQTRKKSEKEKIIKNLLDSKTLFGSLKSIYKNINFGLSIAERGVPEGSEDCQSVTEVLAPDSNELFTGKSSDKLSGLKDNQNDRLLGDGVSSNYMQFDSEYDLNKETRTSSVMIKKDKRFDLQKLNLDMNADNGKPFLDWKSHNATLAVDSQPGNRDSRNKWIVNCESTVYEHKGVSYCYEYDPFQTTFDTSKDIFTPISDSVKTGTVNASHQHVGGEEGEASKTADDIQDEIEESEIAQTDTTNDSEYSLEVGDKSKFRLSKYFSDQSDGGKLGVSKHLCSPLRQRNVMRYEKSSKIIDSKENDPSFDTNSSTQDTVNEDNADADEVLEIEVNCKPSSSLLSNRKTPLMSRFLKNVSQKKAFSSKLRQNEFFQKKIKEESAKFPSVCFPVGEKISPTFKIAAKYLNSLITKEVMENRRISVKLMTADEPSYFDSFEENVAIECCEKLKLELFRDPSEVLHRMLKVRSLYSQENGQWNPQLVFITNRALYLADVESGKSTYNLLYYLTHDMLEVIVIGPDSQYVQIFDKTGESKCTLITGDRYLCHRLVSSLEWSSRNCRKLVGNKVVHGSIPSVIWKERDCLKRLLLKSTSYDRYERCLFYGMVGSSAPPSFNAGRPTSPFGQVMEGFLMYKTEKQKHWRPSFFLLKSGVLSYGSSTLPISASASCLPHAIDLKSVIGVRRCTDVQGRPYCFEVALSVGSSFLQMAAPDDDVASQWLQGLLMHAAQALEGPKIDPSKKLLPPCCTLLVSTKHIVTLREDLDLPKKLTISDLVLSSTNNNVNPQNLKGNIEILSFASITDLTALKIPDSDDNWCILEFVFCEVHEGTEMGFLFTSSAELERFISTVESIWHTTNEGVFPISIQPSSDITSGRCNDWHNRLVTAWDKLLPAAQR